MVAFTEIHIRRATLLALGLLGASYGACTSDDTPAPDAGVQQAPDASVDATPPRVDAGSTADAGHDAAPEVDAASDASDAADSSDASGAADSAPRFDDAGCPAPTGALGNAADAGLPSTGLALWLRADQGVATLDGGAVCRWDDLSGNHRTFLPGTTTPPVVDPVGVAGKPGVSFAGQTQYMIRNDVLGIPPTSGRTFAVYGRSGDTTHRFQYVFQAAPGTPGVYAGIDANTFQTAGSRMGVYVANNSFDSNLATSTTPHGQILSIDTLVVGTPMPGNLVYAVDGTTTTLTRTAGSGNVEDFSSANTTWLCTSTGAGFTGGSLGEALIYDRPLTAPERAAVQQYFQARFP